MREKRTHTGRERKREREGGTGTDTETDNRDERHGEDCHEHRQKSHQKQKYGRALLVGRCGGGRGGSRIDYACVGKRRERERDKKQVYDATHLRRIQMARPSIVLLTFVPRKKTPLQQMGVAACCALRRLLLKIDKDKQH